MIIRPVADAPWYDTPQFKYFISFNTNPATNKILGSNRNERDQLAQILKYLRKNYNRTIHIPFYNKTDTWYYQFGTCFIFLNFEPDTFIKILCS